MSKAKYIIGFFIFCCFIIFAFFLLISFLLIITESDRGGFDFFPALVARNRIALVPIEGIITDSRDIMESLNRFSRRSSVRGIVLRIESPGGGISAAQEIYQEVLRIRHEKNIPVVTSMGGVSASGGFYIACASDKIFANPGTITGSIGVIAEWIDYSDVLKWARLNDVVFKSGEFKNSGSGRKKITEREQEYFEELINELFEQFVDDVAESRSLSREEVLDIADGKAFSGRVAKELGLVDDLGNLYDAIRETARLAGIKGEPVVVEERQEDFSFIDLVVDRLVLKVMDAFQRGGGTMRYQYRW
jgi:protease-4